MINLKNITIGKGIPKICIPLVSKTLSQLKDEVSELKNVDFDILEWRIDFFDNFNNYEIIKEGSIYITETLNKPILFTFRSKKEGGEKDISEDAYFELVNEIISSKLIDLIDIELFMNENKVSESIGLAAKNNIKVIISNHDFAKTPPKEEILNRFKRMCELKADICKIAVMPQSPRDVLTLLDATLTMKELNKEVVLVSMSMSQLGITSRISGETFGSAITFASYKKSSAPGQIEVKTLKDILKIVAHN